MLGRREHDRPPIRDDLREIPDVGPSGVDHDAIRQGRRKEDTMGSPSSAVLDRARQRWWVHLTLIVTAVVSLVLEPMLTLHIALGLVFVGFVAVHLVQRRQVSTTLLARLRRPTSLGTPGGRLAATDAVLTALTLVMFGSGLWDWAAG